MGLDLYFVLFLRSRADLLPISPKQLISISLTINSKFLGVERFTYRFANEGDEIADEQFVLVLENAETGAIRGTCQLMTQVGQQWPFYSYRLNTLTQYSQELDRTVRAELLSLVTDLEGSSEVGGLFLHPNERAGGLGLLLARSRYLFIAMHRSRFGDRVIAELRGVIDERGYLSITGRLKEMIIVGGENVFPREIEDALDAHESVEASAVVGMQDDMRGEVPVAAVTLAEGAAFDQQALPVLVLGPWFCQAASPRPVVAV